eukprot:TRINITY_DN8148_c0_g1_i1.p1 TRINITY_DN8148_c0_g1~~TRINITY_DN8148_c0_g1_i1.p1  ORF type:complete len:899 (+),score=400.32 TRINITY_DN8148_c0_g1_i1:57-2699(+)
MPDQANYINELVNKCLRSSDVEGDYAAIFALARQCVDGMSMQVLEVIKRPLKNATDQQGQLRMVHLLEQLMNNATLNFHRLLASEAWVSRLIDVAATTRLPTVRAKIHQLLVDWAHVYGDDAQLYGFYVYGVEAIKHSGFPCPKPSISQQARKDILARHAAQTQGSARAPRVNPPISSSAYARAAPSGPLVGSTVPSVAVGVKSGAAPPRGAVYGAKMPAGGRPAASPTGGAAALPPGFQVSASGIAHRDPQFRVDDIDMFLMELDSNVTALTNAIQRQDLLKELPELKAEVVNDKARVNQLMAKGAFDEPTRIRLMQAYNNAREALECHAAVFGDFSDAEGSDDGSEGGAPPGDLSQNATAARLGLVDSGLESDEEGAAAAGGGAASGSVIALKDKQGEIERLQRELREAQGRENQLRRELKESRVEAESLKAQVQTAGQRGGGAGGLSPQTLAALREFRAKSRVILNDYRQTNLALVRDVEEGTNFMNVSFKRALDAMNRLVRIPTQEGLIKKLQADYLKEYKLRKEYFNKIQELRGNIRVYCRVRPMNKKEIHEVKTADITAFPLPDEIHLMDEENPKKTLKKYDFDRVFQPKETQEEVFKDTAPLIESVIDGYNVCIFAYGQTGSGKTFTMEGPKENPGVYTRALHLLFSKIEANRETEDTSVELSILEVYNEQICDLLVPASEARSKQFNIRTGGDTGNYVEGLSSRPVRSMQDIDKWCGVAHQHRTSGKTNMNEHSSRSHMVLYFIVRTTNIATGNQCYGKLSLIDLAGSERLKKSQATGQAAVEAAHINKSLSALGDTISSLGGKAKYVPYRNSKLTFLLQDSLSGNSKVLMFANISPAGYNTTETIATLEFANRARNTALGQAQKNVAPGRK